MRLPTHVKIYDALNDLDELTDADRAKLLRGKHLISLRSPFETMRWGKVIHQTQQRGKVYFREGRFCCRFRHEWREVTVERWSMDFDDGRTHTWLRVEM